MLRSRSILAFETRGAVMITDVASRAAILSIGSIRRKKNSDNIANPFAARVYPRIIRSVFDGPGCESQMSLTTTP